MVELGRWEFKITISYIGAACFMGPITSNGREATVTERAARSNPQRAVGEAHCELYVSQKVIDAHLKALSTPGGQNLEIVEISYMGGFSSQNGIFHSNGHNFASNTDFLASPDVLESRRTRLHDAQKISSIRPLGAKCELVRF